MSVPDDGPAAEPDRLEEFQAELARLRVKKASPGTEQRFRQHQLPVPIVRVQLNGAAQLGGGRVEPAQPEVAGARKQPSGR